MKYKATDSAINIITECEGCALEAYPDYEPNGKIIWTIGYGHTRTTRNNSVITKEQAIELLKSDIKFVEIQLNRLNLTINQNKFDALVSFVYNIGIGNFLESALFKKIKSGASDEEIRHEFSRWKFDDGKVKNGLIKRRKLESDLYLKND